MSNIYPDRYILSVVYNNSIKIYYNYNILYIVAIRSTESTCNELRSLWAIGLITKINTSKLVFIV